MKLAFDGIADGRADAARRRLPAGRPARRARTGRSRSRTAILLDTTPPAVTGAATAIYTHISPDGDGRNDVFSVPYRLSEPGHAILIVDGRQAVRHAASPQARRAALERQDRRPRRQDRQPRAADRPRATPPATASKPFPFAVVRVRYVALGRDRVLASPGGRFAILALADAAQVTWRFNGAHAASRRPGTLRFKAPRKPGVYRLYVPSGGHSAKALVVVA